MTLVETIDFKCTLAVFIHQGERKKTLTLILVDYYDEPAFLSQQEKEKKKVLSAAVPGVVNERIMPTLHTS